MPLSRRLLRESVPTDRADPAASFNDMLDRLEGSFRRLSDFSSDLAHELRTPVSSLMTQTEVALSRSRSAEEYREILYSNLEEYDRLARMIADMLFLAKADHGLIVPNRESIDLAAETDRRSIFPDCSTASTGLIHAASATARAQASALRSPSRLSKRTAAPFPYRPKTVLCDSRFPSERTLEVIGREGCSWRPILPGPMP